jgi:hypothetical protein
LVGDTVHAVEVQFPKPSVTTQYDIDAKRTILLLPRSAPFDKRLDEYRHLSYLDRVGKREPCSESHGRRTVVYRHDDPADIGGRWSFWNDSWKKLTVVTSRL